MTYSAFEYIKVNGWPPCFLFLTKGNNLCGTSTHLAKGGHIMHQRLFSSAKCVKYFYSYYFYFMSVCNIFWSQYNISYNNQMSFFFLVRHIYLVMRRGAYLPKRLDHFGKEKNHLWVELWKTKIFQSFYTQKTCLIAELLWCLQYFPITVITLNMRTKVLEQTV